ncbi:MAG TPA: TlyA family RNA methyltransferase [Candidatus Limnocylindrales bacterium]|nr:TlyA family RNA methyltransferase [Candidatus Limnocylindrales bacterium]
MTEKQRLDLLVLSLGLAPSREKARALIMAGEVLVDGSPADKPGMPVRPDAEIVVKSRPRYVSRGGDKLAGALAAFSVAVAGKVCADVGASTGGFTDCLLQNGAAHVYAIDVGYGQIAYPLRIDERVTTLERTNVRYLVTLPEAVSLVVMDASFISLRLLLPVVQNWLTPEASIIPLIKPQFEAGPQDVGRGGVVRDPDVHRRVLMEVLSFAHSLGLTPRDLIKSPLRGPAGNIEFLAWLVNTPGYAPNLDQLIDAVI